MNERVTRFYEAVSADGKLQEELVAVTEGVGVDNASEEEARVAMAEAVAAFAAAHDLDLAAEDILAADGDARQEGEISDAELEAVAGGASCACAWLGMLKECGCFLYGKGKGADEFISIEGGSCAVAGF